jgi:hypothetical protein
MGLFSRIFGGLSQEEEQIAVKMSQSVFMDSVEIFSLLDPVRQKLLIAESVKIFKSNSSLLEQDLIGFTKKMTSQTICSKEYFAFHLIFSLKTCESLIQLMDKYPNQKKIIELVNNTCKNACSIVTNITKNGLPEEFRSSFPRFAQAFDNFVSNQNSFYSMAPAVFNTMMSEEKRKKGREKVEELWVIDQPKLKTEDTSELPF